MKSASKRSLNVFRIRKINQTMKIYTEMNFLKLLHEAKIN